MGGMSGQTPAGGPLPDDDDPRPAWFVAEDDFDLDEHFAWLVGEIEAGRQQPPPESAVDGPRLGPAGRRGGPGGCPGRRPASKNALVLHPHGA